jgi:Zn-dependent protease
MFLSEPAPTQFDLHFRVAGIPVRVHPLFWLISLAVGFQGEDPVRLLIWVGVVFVSILVHELGHALTMQFFGQRARVVLYAMGGMAVADASPWGIGRGHRYRSSREQILISAAGPGAGFLLAGATVGLVFAAGGRVQFELVHGFLPYALFVPSPTVGEAWFWLVNFLLQVNIFWGLVNLLPVYPLDGGQIAQEICVRQDPYNGTARCLWLSMVVAVTVAVVGAVVLQDRYLAILFGWLALSSYLTWQQLGGGRG